ncbi:MAG: signal peptidase I [Turicibacter sp.]|nr:signal peptidase I [Turicibacter sp.]
MFKKILYSLLGLMVSLVFLNLLTARSDTAFNLIGFRTYTILTGSMIPFANPGDAIFVTANPSNLQVGDVITYHDHQGGITTHRIVDIEEAAITTRGDNNNVDDAHTIDFEAVIGRVWFAIPGLGFVMNFLGQPLMTAGLMVLLGLIVGSHAMFSNEKNVKKVQVE